MSIFSRPRPRLAIVQPRPEPTQLRGLAAEINAVANQTSDPLARASLNAIVPRVARLQRSNEEMAAELTAEAQLLPAGRA